MKKKIYFSFSVFVDVYVYRCSFKNQNYLKLIQHDQGHLHVDSQKRSKSFKL